MIWWGPHEHRLHLERLVSSSPGRGPSRVALMVGSLDSAGGLTCGDHWVTSPAGGAITEGKPEGWGWALRWACGPESWVS